MLKSEEIRRQAAQRLKELFPTAKGWEESIGARIGSQNAGLVLKFKLGEQDHTLVLEVCSLGQPRQIRAAVTRLREIRREVDNAYPLAAAVYIGPQSARILKNNGLGYVDLSGNCSPGLRAASSSTRKASGTSGPRPGPCAPCSRPAPPGSSGSCSTDPGRAWRLEELGKAAGVSLGHSHNVMKRLADLRLGRARRSPAHSPHEARRPAGELVRVLHLSRERHHVVRGAREDHATIHGGAGPGGDGAGACLRLHAQCRPLARRAASPVARASTAISTATRRPWPWPSACVQRPRAEGSLVSARALRPRRVFYGALEKGGLKVTSLPQLYADLVGYDRRGRGAGRASAPRGDGLLRRRDRSEVPNERG